MSLVHPTPSLVGVFDKLVRDIVSRRFLPGACLPAERDLSRGLGASRPTLREALRQLGEWGLVEPRRGSGVAVRHPDDWSFDVLPSYLRFGAAAAGPAALLQTVKDLLETRRLLFLDVLRLVAPRLVPGRLDAARAHVARAWAARDDAAAFIREDFEAVRAMAAAARLLPALWMLNSVAGVYRELASTLGGAAHLPDDYLDVYRQVMAALERNDAETACAAMTRYLENHDRCLLGALQGEGKP
jgi:GntR family transcriptional regulator, transcriptional repressor for pyruvate dehydrogenase complex